jgi:hypothetical protein
MLQDGLQKVLLGETSFDEILKLIDLDDDLGSGTQLGLEEQMEDSQAVINQQPVMMNPSVMPPNGQPMYMPYPVPMQLDPDTLKQLLELAKDMPTNDNKEKNENKTNKQEEVKPVITDNTPDEILDEEIETLDSTPKVNLDELTKNELSKEELETADFSTLDDEEFLDIDVDDDYKLDNKKEDKPIVTLTLNETNTVKPIPISIDEGFSNITIKPHNINRDLNKNKKVLDEDNMEVVTIKPKKASKTADKKSGKKNKKGKKKLN